MLLLWILILLFLGCTIMTQVVKGLLYLHKHGIMHRDITLANLLLTKDGKIVRVAI